MINKKVCPFCGEDATTSGMHIGSGHGNPAHPYCWYFANPVREIKNFKSAVAQGVDARYLLNDMLPEAFKEAYLLKFNEDERVRHNRRLDVYRGEPDAIRDMVIGISIALRERIEAEITFNVLIMPTLEQENSEVIERLNRVFNPEYYVGFHVSDFGDGAFVIAKEASLLENLEGCITSKS